MLYFDAVDIEKILNGSKTSARILFKNGDYSEAISLGGFGGGGPYNFKKVYRNGNVLFAKGETVGISTDPDTPEIARIMIRGIDRDNLHFDDENSGIERDLPDEGFADLPDKSMLEQFIEHWDQTHPIGKHWADDPR